MEQIKILQRAVDQAGKVVANMGYGQLGLSTPCTEWNVRDMVNHLISSLHMFSQAAMGAKFDLQEYGIDRVKYDATVSYAQESAKLKIALGRAGWPSTSPSSSSWPTAGTWPRPPRRRSSSIPSFRRWPSPTPAS